MTATPSGSLPTGMVAVTAGTAPAAAGAARARAARLIAAALAVALVGGYLALAALGLAELKPVGGRGALIEIELVLAKKSAKKAKH